MKQTYNNRLNIELARSLYDFPGGHLGRTYLSRRGKDLSYSPAYVLTNEDLRDTVQSVPAMGKDVLTVAGSGDQALFYTLAGAKHIDTFDISFCAKAIMDIKVSAIQQGYSYNNFFNLLNDLHHGKDIAGTAPEIAAKLPTDSAIFTQQMKGYRIFGNGWRPGNYDAENLNANEYAVLQAMKISDYDFIWSNVADLHTKTTKQYDIINLSNIFEWSPTLLVPTIENLRNNVKPGGHILVQSGEPIGMHTNYPIFAQAQRTVADWAKVWLKTDNPNNNILMLQRIR